MLQFIGRKMWPFIVSNMSSTGDANVSITKVTFSLSKTAFHQTNKTPKTGSVHDRLVKSRTINKNMRQSKYLKLFLKNWDGWSSNYIAALSHTKDSERTITAIASSFFCHTTMAAVEKKCCCWLFLNGSSIIYWLCL